MLAILNYLLILAATAASVSGYINGMGDEYDTLGFSGLILPILALVVILLRSFRAPAKKMGTHWFLWPVALVLLSRTLFTTTDLHDVYAALLTVSVLLPAIVRPELSWATVFVFSAVSYSALLAVERKVWLEPSLDFTFYTGLLEFAAVSLFAGLIPWWILRKRGQAQEREFNSMLEDVRNNAITNAMARTRSMAPELSKKMPSDQMATGVVTASIATGTLRMDAVSNDTFALLNVAGEEVNSQLKSMLYFMRYNFKALTASAFIYDAMRRVLVLNCYDTKPGAVQISENAQIPFGAGVIGREVASEKRMFISGDLSLYPGGSGLSYYAQDAGVCSIMAAPIVADSGGKEFIGVLAVDSINKNAFSDHDKELMLRFSKIAGALIGNIKMRLELDLKAELFRIYYEVSHKFSVALKMEEIFAAIMEELPKIIRSCTRLIFVLYDPEKNALRLQLIGGAKEELTEGSEFSPEAGGIYAYVFNKCEAVDIPDLQAQRSYRFVPEEKPSQTTRSLLVLPIVGGEERKCIGLFSVESNEPGLFRSGETRQIATTIIENASVAVARALLYLKMEKLATTDGLTGLNNHRTFQEIMAREFERAKRYGRPISLLLTDIDHFKSFNDTYGHPVGDLVLREIAGCIRSAVRLNDYPARYGGEEFAVVLPETDESGAYVIAERIRQAVEARVIESGSNMLRVTISIGCVTFPTYGTTQQEIIDCSDKALYASKKGGRNRVTMYNPGMTVSSK